MTYTDPSFPPNQPPPRKRRTGRALLIAVLVGVVLLCGIGGIAVIAGGGDSNNDPEITAQDDTNRAAARTSSAAPPAGKATTAPTTSATLVAVRVDDGTYTVGEDIPAGSYKVVERAGELCYWQLEGPNEGDLDNGVGGGFPTFTAKRGQKLTIMSCPAFELRPAKRK